MSLDRARKSIGFKLRLERKEKGWSQLELSKISGVAEKTIGQITEEIESIPGDFDEAIEKLKKIIELGDIWEINKRKLPS